MKGEDCSSICDGGVGLPRGKYKVGKQSRSHQSTFEVCARETGETGLTTAFHQGKIEPIPCCCMVSWKRRAIQHSGAFCGIGSFCRRVQIAVLSILCFRYKRVQCAGLVLNSLDRSVAVCLLARHE